jgi:hypothetical protein
MFLRRYARAGVNWLWMTWRTPALWRNPIQWITAYNAAALGRWAWTAAPYVPKRADGIPWDKCSGIDHTFYDADGKEVFHETIAPPRDDSE